MIRDNHMPLVNCNQSSDIPWQPDRHNNVIHMIETLHTCLKVAPIIVPADGNCLAWSLRAHFLEQYVQNDWESKGSVRSVKHVRSILKDMWAEKRMDPAWQQYWNCCSEPEVQPADEQQVPKSDKGESAEGILVKQGPDVVPAEGSQRNKQRVQAVKSAVPVPIATREPASPTLRNRDSARLQMFMEPTLPDVEENVSKALLRAKPVDEVWDEDLLDHVEDKRLTTKIKRGQHERVIKKPKESETEKEKRLKAMLSKFHMTYGQFKQDHNRSAAVRKAGYCAHGGYKELKKVLKQGAEPTCPVCLKWWHRKKLTVQYVKEFLETEQEHWG